MLEEVPRVSAISSRVRSIDGPCLRKCVRLVAFTLVSYLWFWLTLGSPEWHSASLPQLYVLCLLPCLSVWLIIVRYPVPPFAPVAIVILTALAALPVPLFPYSNDEAFYLAKSFWAARGEYFIDPVMGIPTGYPALYHIVTGVLSRVTGLDHVAIGQFSLVAAFLSLLAICWLAWKKHLGSAHATMSLWIMGLGLYGKEWSAHLLSGSAAFSMPFALGGWIHLALTGRRASNAILGCILIAVAIALWPPHIFAAIGVLIVSLLWKDWFRLRLYLGMGSILGFASSIGVRSLSGAEVSMDVLQKWPESIPQFITGRLLALVTFGSDAHGWTVIMAACTITLFFGYLVAFGWKTQKQQAMVFELGRIGTGLFSGVFLALILLRHTSYANRLLFVTAAMLAPVAAAGALQISTSFPDSVRRFGKYLFAWLCGLWLIPTMLAVAMTAQQWYEWSTHTRPATNFLNQSCRPKDRIWAETEDFCHVALGQVPVFGVLGHPDPTYFSAPPTSAAYFGSSYYRLLGSASLTDWLETAREVDIRWVVLRRDRTPPLSWMLELALSYTPAFENEVWAIYDVSKMASIRRLGH